MNVSVLDVSCLVTTIFYRCIARYFLTCCHYRRLYLRANRFGDDKILEEWRLRKGRYVMDYDRM